MCYITLFFVIFDNSLKSPYSAGIGVVKPPLL